MNNYINEKIVKNLGYSLETFMNFSRFQQENIMLNYFKSNIVSLSNEQLDYIFQDKMDDIIERETKKIIKKFNKIEEEYGKVYCY